MKQIIFGLFGGIFAILSAITIIYIIEKFKKK